MIFQLRFYFVVMLVLLQLVAPLIHAHKNDKTNLGTSFHLPEFEQVNAFFEKDSVMIAPCFHEGEIVTVSAGIKENQRRFLLNESLYIFVIPFFLLMVIMYEQIEYLLFSVHTEPIKHFRFFNLVAPRAPPHVIHSF